MMEDFGEIMILEETAKYLKIGKSTFYKGGKGKKNLRRENWEYGK